MPDEASAPKLNYPGNSQKAREAKVKPDLVKEKNLEKVIIGEAVKRKKPLSRKITETFTGDYTHEVGNYVFFDVVVPAIKALVVDVFQQGVERLVYGDVRGRMRPGSGIVSGIVNGTINNRTPYNNLSKSSSIRQDSSNGREMSKRGREVHDFDEIILATRGEAEAVIDGLTAILDEYESASVYDLYELVGVTGSFADNKWGWTNLAGSQVESIRQGYLLTLPKPISLD